MSDNTRITWLTSCSPIRRCCCRTELLLRVWSKCLTNSPGYYSRYGDSAGSQASADKAFQEYVYNLNLDYGYCDHDVTNVFNGYITYDIPLNKGKMFDKNAPKVAKVLLADWQLNTIFTVHGGFPISLYDFSDPGGATFGSTQARWRTPHPELWGIVAWAWNAVLD